MDQKKLNDMIKQIEAPLKNETLADGLTELSAALAHIVVLSINQGVFDRSKVHKFFEEIEEGVMVETKPKGIKRAD